MSTAQAVLLIAAVCVLFATVHSALAMDRVKEAFARALGETTVRAWYRLAYTLVSVIMTVMAAYMVMSVPDIPLLVLEGPLRLLARLAQGLGVALVLMAMRVVDGWEFIGLRQAVRRLRGESLGGDCEGLTSHGLVTDGVFSIVRNPLYLGGILIVTFSPDITRTWATVVVLADAYFILGALIEERRLAERFGDEYRQYRARVPLLLPDIRAFMGKRLTGRRTGR
jgi:hypothetical protein